MIKHDENLGQRKVKSIVYFGAVALFICAGCTHLAPGRLGTNEDVSGAGMVFLESRWFTGGFGDQKPEWTGRNFRNDLSMITHLPTRSHVFIAVRRYSDEEPRAATDSKSGFATRIGEGIMEMFDGVPISQKTNEMSIFQVTTEKGGHEKRNYTFVIFRYFTENRNVDRYSDAGRFLMIHYLADVGSDADGARPTGTLFQVRIVLPANLDPLTQDRLVSVSEKFLTNDMRLNRRGKRNR
jgi:hypothetical protein